VRLIDAGKFENAKKVVFQGKKRWLIKRVDLNRYRHIEGNWLWRQTVSVPTLD
jgi:hypothetical protein